MHREGKTYRNQLVWALLQFTIVGSGGLLFLPKHLVAFKGLKLYKM